MTGLAAHRLALTCLLGLAGCSRGQPADRDAGDGDADGSLVDGATVDGATWDGPAGDGDGGTGGDGGSGGDDGGSGGLDGGSAGADASSGDVDADVGIITGGPCLSGAAGATAYRIRWANGGGTAYVVYEVNGLPGNTDDHAGAYGYQIGFTPAYVDTFLAQGGLQLDSSDFVDLELSTAGLAQITSATLSIYGRSYNTTASGSFNWQTFEGTGSAPTNLVSNVAPYAWYSADMTTEILPGDDGVLIRIKAGPSSGALVVNRIELCMEAD